MELFGSLVKRNGLTTRMLVAFGGLRGMELFWLGLMVFSQYP